ncbi:tandem C2 domains nuclear protein isoform X2 [Trichomycterus rosablanca]|uniref:tandem C2 domains nuclear protein isoform X2 n=1 Tax=Trichomycterus rosablanca TaxID=2290929 RepID=UPI002F351384
MAMMECIKNCCKNFLNKEKEPELQIVTIPTLSPAPEVEVRKSALGVSEDYLLSKLPPDGREVPFVLPLFKPSYVQPQGLRYPTYQGGLHARVTYEERKAELAAASDMVYDPTMSFHQSHLISYISPGAIKGPFLKGNYSSALDQSAKQRLRASMMDLSSPHSPIQRHDSLTSVPSSTSSIQDSFGSNRSIESSTVSSEDREQDLGKVCVILRYQEDVEQVWITVVECKDLCLSSESAKQQRVGFKGVITMAKPVQFKTSVKEATPDLLFMETFVFTLNLEQLRSSALVLRLQTHTPRKHTQGECMISLRTLGPQETQHWLDLSPPCKTHVCHAELQLSTCFQPVSSRIQLQILTAQNLPTSSSLRTQRFYVKVEMFREGCFLLKKKTKIVKSSGNQVQWGEFMFLPISIQDHEIQLVVRLYSCGSIRRKYLLGQVMLGFNSPSADAVEQWRDSVKHPEKVVTAWHRLSHS